MIRAIVFDCFGVIVNRGVDDAVLELILQLQKNYKIGLISNTGVAWIERELTDEQRALFDAVALSGEMGFGKPDVRAYLDVARRLEEFPSDCLMIDDSQQNCAGARDAGMSAIHYTNVADLRRELEKYGILTP